MQPLVDVFSVLYIFWKFNQISVRVPSIEGGRHATVNLGFAPDSQPKTMHKCYKAKSREPSSEDRFLDQI